MKLYLLHENVIIGSPKLVYLDLDETLVHTFVVKPSIRYIEVSAGYTSPRPYLFEFLKGLRSSGYTINLMTYGTRAYANEVLRKLNIVKYFSEIFAREDIIELYSDNKRTLPSGALVDNEMPMHKVNLVFGKKILVKSWNGNAKDRELLRVLGILR